MKFSQFHKYPYQVRNLSSRISLKPADTKVHLHVASQVWRQPFLNLFDKVRFFNLSNFLYTCCSCFFVLFFFFLLVVYGFYQFYIRPDFFYWLSMVSTGFICPDFVYWLSIVSLSINVSMLGSYKGEIHIHVTSLEWGQINLYLLPSQYLILCINSGSIEIQLLLSLYVPLKSLSIEKKNRPKLITGTLALFMYLELCYVNVTYDFRVFLNISTS